MIFYRYFYYDGQIMHPGTKGNRLNGCDEDEIFPDNLKVHGVIRVNLTQNRHHADMTLRKHKIFAAILGELDLPQEKLGQNFSSALQEITIKEA